MVGSCHGGQLSPVGSCHGGQLLPVGSCCWLLVVGGGQLSCGAVIGWSDVVWSVMGGQMLAYTRVLLVSKILKQQV